MSNYFNENGVLNSTLMNCADDWNLRRKKKKKETALITSVSSDKWRVLNSLMVAAISDMGSLA
jgi:hypothetical protein